MKVKELIKQLQSVKNQDARVDIYVPYELENDTSNDYSTENFEVHTINEHDGYVEFYCTDELNLKK
jgi:hypothetical protein